MRILFWFRKDLRLDDNTGLHEAVRDAAGDVVPFYTGEPALLARDDVAPTRVRFVLESLADLARQVERAGSRLALDHGEAADTVVRAALAAGADAVYWNEEYEPALAARDRAVRRALADAGIAARSFHDRLLVAPGLVHTRDGAPYTVFTAFRRACEALPPALPLPRVTRLAAHALPRRRVATLERLGFATAQERWPGGAAEGARRLERFLEHALAGYPAGRDLPGETATSRLSADLRFGTLSARTVAHAALERARGEGRSGAAGERFLAELRWRDFFAHVLHHFPHAARGAFRRTHARIRWRGRRAHLAAWREGSTGYPLVDAGMRELAATGWMHNRARMVTASFLVKDLLLDWRHGERHFMRHLVDGDPASNNGGWQWVASTGTDAQPWFRIFNPVLQGRRFDPDGRYVRRWVPELARLPERWLHAPWEAPPVALAEAGIVLGAHYPEPIVDHQVQAGKAVAMYREATAKAPECSEMAARQE